MKKKSKKKPISLKTIPSLRLKKCFRSGSVLGLFPLLKGWSKRELRALLKDVEIFHTASLKRLENKVKELTTDLGKDIDSIAIRLATNDAHNTLTLRLMTVCSEIDSVALYYLDREKSLERVS